ncbi:MAG: putative inorganic carbon transporter subunit DabA, partial [Planctomycetaceae bacterium]
GAPNGRHERLLFLGYLQGVPEPCLPALRSRVALDRGSLRIEDLVILLAEHLGGSATTVLCGGRTTLHDVLRTMLLHPVRHETDTAVRWTLTERDPFPSPESVDLWQACVESVSGFRPFGTSGKPPVRHRDLVLAVRPSLDTDRLVHPHLVRFLAAFLDQGVAAWPMPDRERGMLFGVASVGSVRGSPNEPWNRPLVDRWGRILARFRDSEDAENIATGVAVEELVALGVPPDAWHDHVLDSLVAIRGWAGLVRQLELRPDRAPVDPVPARLMDLLAVRLVFDRAATDWVARSLEPPGVVDEGGGRLGRLWTELRDRHPGARAAECPADGQPGSVARAYLLHQVFDLLGITASDVRSLGENDVLALEQAVSSFDAVARRHLFHLAYERRYRSQILDALGVRARVTSRPSAIRPEVQAVFCIDDRCESFRRHLEEIRPAVETFGAAGFFSVPMIYRGLDDWHATPLCPLPVRPSHTVHEVPEDGADRDYARRRMFRQRMGWARKAASSGSRTLLLGGLLTSVGGAVAAVPLVAQVLFPRLAAIAADRAVRFARLAVPSRLHLRRVGEERLPDGTFAGFSVDEMAAAVRDLLETVGLARKGPETADGSGRLARFVVIVGHGSTSLNNPHESAYDCGACGGGRGGPNARAFAIMANDPDVRRRLADGGLLIPDDTRFVGGMLDTCMSRVTWYDTASLPPTHAEEFEALRMAFDEAGRRDARERCRRFESVALGLSEEDALRKVQGRSCDLAQVRPEYGHASTAICIVGRRSRTRGLFLDRRSFLMSYDPNHDADGEILERILAAVGPVCGGISLAYMFSRIDPTVYGAGTKLPHNLTGLVGVMDGHADDLRTGLPLQGVEIHEPMRLLMIVEAPIERIARVVERLPAVKALVWNRWIQLAAWDPESSDIAIHDGLGEHGFSPYKQDLTSLPRVATSAAWYGGTRDHLPPALIGDFP